MIKQTRRKYVSYSADCVKKEKKKLNLLLIDISE